MFGVVLFKVWMVSLPPSGAGVRATVNEYWPSTAGAVGHMLLATVALNVHVPIGQQPVSGMLVSGSVGGGVLLSRTKLPETLKLALHTSLLSIGGGGWPVVVGSSPPTPHAVAHAAKRRLAPAIRVMSCCYATPAPA